MNTLPRLSGTLLVMVFIACDGSTNDDSARCGNAMIEAGEACDGASLGGTTCADLGLGDGQLACRADCSGFETSMCASPPPCGNGVHDPGEECDDGQGNSDTLADACRTDCTAPSCGDGVTDAGEACDDGAGNSDTLANACRTDCTAPSCGDGVIDAGEACDDGAGNSDSLANACRTDCTAPSCGDGVIDTGEDCDGTADHGRSCADFGYSIGGLSCTGQCTLDTSGCTNGECSSNADCNTSSYCAKPEGSCSAEGQCMVRPTICNILYAPVCGCDGVEYSNSCWAANAGMSVAIASPCP